MSNELDPAAMARLATVRATEEALAHAGELDGDPAYTDA